MPRAVFVDITPVKSLHVNRRNNALIGNSPTTAAASKYGEAELIFCTLRLSHQRPIPHFEQSKFRPDFLLFGDSEYDLIHTFAASKP